MNFQKPENALRRADELMAVNQPEHALQVIHQTIGHRRFRSLGWEGVQEQIMLQYVALCVDLNKLQTVREGLHQYRTIAQQANSVSLGKVLRELRERAENKLTLAKKKVENLKVLEDLAEDLEAEESPESLLSMMLSVDFRDESSKEVRAALRTCWECYKMILDILRTTPKQELVYHETAQRALDFCSVNSRPQEFKKLCEVIRNHYSLLQKNRTKPEYESLLRPEIHLETKLEQLKVASKLELWRESFQTAEDIFALGLYDLLLPKATSTTAAVGKVRAAVAVYYEKLAQVFWVSDLLLFHAHTSIKHLIHSITYRKDVDSATVEMMSSCSVLAVLSIPYCAPDRKQDTATQIDLDRRLASLLNHPTIPTRDGLKAVLVRREGQPLNTQRVILLSSRPSIQTLYRIIETQEINPLDMCEKCAPLLADIVTEPKFAQYAEPIKRVVFHKIILQLSHVYTSMSISYFTRQICKEDFIPWNQAEKIIVHLAHSELVELRIDYASNAIYFGSNSIDAEYTIRKQLFAFGQQMIDAVAIIDESDANKQRARRREDFYTNINEKLVKEASRLKARNIVVKARHNIQMEEQQKLEDWKKKLEQEKLENEERLEAQRRAEEQKKREEFRRKEEQDKERREAAEFIVEELKKLLTLVSKTKGKDDDKDILVKGVPLGSIDVDKLASGFLTFEDFEAVQQEVRVRDRQDKLAMRKQQAKRLDHLVRALLEEEMPLLEEWEEQLVLGDSDKLKRTNTTREQGLALLGEFKPYRDARINNIMTIQQKERNAVRKEIKVSIVAKMKSQKLQRAVAAKTAETERKKAKEIKDEEDKKEAKAERLRKEEEDKKTRLNAQALKQAARDREIEEKLNISRKDTPCTPCDEDNDGSNWRRK